MLELGILDFIFGGLVLTGAIMGIFRGLLKELYLLSAFLLAFLSSIVLSLPITQWWGQRLEFLSGQYLFTFLLLFLISMALLTLVLHWVMPNTKKTKISWKSRISGFFLGLIHGGFYIALLSWILMQQKWIMPEKLFSGDQKFYPAVVEILLFFTRFYQ